MVPYLLRSFYRIQDFNDIKHNEEYKNYCKLILEEMFFSRTGIVSASLAYASINSYAHIMDQLTDGTCIPRSYICSLSHYY